MPGKIFLFAVFVFVASLPIDAQQVQDKVRAYRVKNEQRIINEYIRFVSIPNVSNDTPNILLNADFILQMMKRRGIDAELLRDSGGQVNPVVFGKVTVPGARHTIAFYAL